MKLWIKNYLSTLIFIGILYIFYHSFDSFLRFFTATFFIQPVAFSFSSLLIFDIVVGLYLVVLPLFYWCSPHVSKALCVVRYIVKKWKYNGYKASFEEKTDFFAWLVKGFWAPLMIFWFSDHIVKMVNSGYALYGTWDLWKINMLGFFDAYFFVFCLSVILFVDVLFFTLGYLVESPKLGNTIKSVDTSILGWAAVLACYPPFNGYVTSLIGWYSQDFPKFENFFMHIGLNLILLVLMAIYSRASWSLGLKASNMTNRGIVTTGAYRYIRHPAYVTKNLAWWIGGTPFIIQALSTSNFYFLFLILFGLIGWSFIYAVRAITEERHLSTDPKYRQYCEKVRYRMIPGFF